MKYFDTHCHFNSPELRADIAKELEQCRAAGVERMAVIGSTLEDSEEAVKISREYCQYGLFPVVGIHPHEAKDAADGLPQRLFELARLPQVRAWGEIGLDYYYDLSPRDVQLRVLEQQLLAAAEVGLPVVFHVREAYDDFWSVINRVGAPRKAVLHCFSGTIDDARRALDYGWKIGVTGVVTFARADEFRTLLAQIPAASLLCETDSPWMSPVPFRGKVNVPSRVPFVYARLAQVKGMELEAFAEQVWRTACDFYGVEVSACLNTD